MKKRPFGPIVMYQLTAFFRAAILWNVTMGDARAVVSHHKKQTRRRGDLPRIFRARSTYGTLFFHCL